MSAAQSVDELTKATASEASAYLDLAKAITWEDFVEIEVPGDGSEAAVVRAKLGLPSNLTENTDYCLG